MQTCKYQFPYLWCKYDVFWNANMLTYLVFHVLLLFFILFIFSIYQFQSKHHTIWRILSAFSNISTFELINDLFIYKSSDSVKAVTQLITRRKLYRKDFIVTFIILIISYIHIWRKHMNFFQQPAHWNALFIISNAQ